MKKLLQLATTILLMLLTVTTTAQIKTAIPNEVQLLQNPYNPMNILLVPSAIEGITPQQGDLVMAFAGDVCAGAAIVEDVDSLLNLVATSTDEVNKGYRSGQAIRLEYHSTYDNTVYKLIPKKIIMGSMTYEKLGTFYAQFKANALSVAQNNSRNIKVYPNPAGHQLYILMEFQNIKSGEKLNLKLININGKTVLTNQYSLNGQVIALDVAGLPAGEYLLFLSGKDVKYTKKIIKQ